MGTPLQGLGNALVFGDKRTLRLRRRLCSRRLGGPLGGGPAYERTGDGDSCTFNTPESSAHLAHLEIDQSEGEDV